MMKILNKILKYNFFNVLEELIKKYPEHTDYLEKIKYDYKNFPIEHIPVQFIAEDNKFCKDFVALSKTAFSKLKHISKTHFGEKIYDNFVKEFGNLTFKEAYILSYFNHNQPRCCFCGSLFPVSMKRKKENDKYKYLDIEYVKVEIEHLFPQSKFPQFIFHPYNLVPICPICNTTKNNTFFDSKEEFSKALNKHNISFSKLHPLNLYKHIKFSSETIIDGKYYNNSTLFEFYNLEKRSQIILDKCFSILFNIIRYSKISSPESLERLLENIASSNWHEVNDGYSLNNSPQIWQEFIENILYDECKLMALWDEVKSSELKFL